MCVCVCVCVNVLLYMCTCICMLTGPMIVGRVFANGPGDRGSISGRVVSV